MSIQARIEDARQQFARSLVGFWGTAQGTFDMVMGQHWEVRPDGTGRFTDTGPFGYAKSETRFEWRQSEPFVFELRLIEYVAQEPDDDTEFDDDDREWKAIRYDFAEVPTDVGPLVGLIDVTQVGAKFGGFLTSLAPLAYSGPIV